ncbi:PDZ domain-containing protein [Thermosulfurimonas dismutans]|uniref:General secretion pathway protein C n=1 Tax=Thermosulfurimonas dismutans TaxID=999894 RepID=A0A179D253_9BACT|nr:PDZ domain-containing protein [Thermosulfurimonas dismutans]OAQ19881.1 General secretion pathway protein C [Thermosulfurimonas dismutans]
MLLMARVLVLLLLVSSAVALLSLGYFQLKLTETPRLPEKSFSSWAHETSSRASFDFERILSGFYLPPEETSSVSPEAFSIEAPELQAIFFGKGVRFALLKTEKESRWAREGERVKGWRVARIAPDFVILVFKDRKVVRKLFESEERLFQGGSIKESPSTSSERPFVISREEIERLTADIGSLFSKIRLRPYFRLGRMEGVLVEYVAPGSIFSQAGLRVGDVILSINGIPVRRNEDAFRILETIKTAPSLSVKIRRGDRILTLKAEVK